MGFFKKRAEKKAQAQQQQQQQTGQHSNGVGNYNGNAAGNPSSMRGYVGSHRSLDPATSMAPQIGSDEANSRMHGARPGNQQQHQQAMDGVDPATGEPIDMMMQGTRPIKHGRDISKRKFNVGGLPVNVFGLDELTPASARALARPPPEVCIAIHMHGRGGSADNEEHIVRHLWDRVARSQAQYAQSNGRAQHDNGHASSMRELLFVNFDARNHGHRKTSTLGQKGWKQDNPNHGMDLYSMIVGCAQDVSFLIDFLPSYLFTHDERHVTQWVVTGKSLGGHSTWHVLANDPRVTVGVPFISCPSYAKLMERRTKTAFVTNGPPYIPHSLAQLVARIDPASRPFDVPDPNVNPFWGKKICMLNGSADKMVPFRCAEDFVQRLVVGPRVGLHGHQPGFRVTVREGLGHEVTDDMVEEGGQWIFTQAIIPEQSY